MKQCLSCLKYYFTLSLPFEQRLVFRWRCEVQNVVSIILKSVRNIDLSWDFFFFLYLVIDGQFMPIVQIPALGRQWFDGLFQMSSLAIRDMLLLHIAACPTFPSRYRLFLTDALWRNAYLKYWVRSGQKATPTNCFFTWFSHIFLCFFPVVYPLSVVVTKVVHQRHLNIAMIEFSNSLTQ